MKIEDAMARLDIDALTKDRIVRCEACRDELLRATPAMVTWWTTEEFRLRSRMAMMHHLGYAPSDHMEAMGL
jgi:hypothetical protein